MKHLLRTPSASEMVPDWYKGPNISNICFLYPCASLLCALPFADHCHRNGRKRRGFQCVESYSFEGSYHVLILWGAVTHRVVGVHLLQPDEQTLHQVISVLEFHELEGHLAADANDDGVGQQTCVLHLLNAHNLWQEITHKKVQRKRREADI